MSKVSEHIASGKMWINQDGKWCKYCSSCNRLIVGKDGSMTTKFNVSHSIIKSKVCHSCIKIGKSTWSSVHKNEMSCRHSGKNHPMYGRHHTNEMRKKQSERNIGKKLSVMTRRKVSDAVKISLRTPEIRKRHIQGIISSPWLKVKTDKGQLEMLQKWNGLGFRFEPNYQVHTDTDLFYVDGYDKEHSVVLEYDGKYHSKYHQKQKDLVRQQKIIDILHPKRFWRYNSVDGSFMECITQKNEPATVVAEQKV